MGERGSHQAKWLERVKQAEWRGTRSAWFKQKIAKQQDDGEDVKAVRLE
eukprot:NODE_16131_length_209_cov_10.800000_g15218_i0.p2 GENE.NODE_16131_length_209_cov_10.800000_g15218_i0~~NODE_16131_length_209_cov_10.800000_g15218_i0.p2  ORF type:complete len:58 (-),score=19.41 NODE_16131_length_209_cov_10.800000_g15218_i0:35-181(-)